MPVQMELRRIIISEVDEHQVIVLKEVEGERSFPIVIGIFEATSIDRRVRGMQSPRPLTHDLIASVIEQLGGEVQDVVISDLEEHTYFARLRVRREGDGNVCHLGTRSCFTRTGSDPARREAGQTP